MRLSMLITALLLTTPALLGLAPTAAARPDLPPVVDPEPTCMPVYREYDLGAVRYVSRDSCHAEIYVGGEQVWPPTAEPAAAGTCVNYAYIADYQWYYLCVDPKSSECKVYQKRVVGVTETRTCLVPTAAPADAGTCVPTSGGLDYQSYACVDAKDPGCAVYTLSHTDAGAEKRCYGVLQPSCLLIYWAHEVGPVKVESRSSCERQVYLYGEPILP